MYELKCLFNMYLEHIKKYKAYNTYMYYKKDFKVLGRALLDLGITSPKHIKNDLFEVLTDWLLKNTNKKNSKINDTISSFITVLNFYSIKYPRRFKLRDDTISFKVLSNEEYSRLISLVKSMDLKYCNNLVLVMGILLSLDTGVRLTELLEIKTKNVDLSSRSIYLEHTKNGIPRYVLFGNLSEKYVSKVLRYKQKYLMWNINSDMRVSRTVIYKFYNKLNAQLHFQYNLHPHRLRKTYATRLLKKGCPLTTISKLLGHKDIKQTMIYLEIDYNMLKIDYDLYYPN
ncbi:MAG: tyrosine-type recombinase/integrase [Tenericutes bacterium]|nr:tyrosine-type recombinase/integrase [Mycoplasmatota bacterium]